MFEMPLEPRRRPVLYAIVSGVRMPWSIAFIIEPCHEGDQNGQTRCLSTVVCDHEWNRATTGDSFRLKSSGWRKTPMGPGKVAASAGMHRPEACGFDAT